MNKLALKVHPVFLTKRPHVAKAFTKWVLIVFEGLLIKYICVLMVWVEEGTSWHLRILCVNFRITDIDLVILKQALLVSSALTP